MHGIAVHVSEEARDGCNVVLLITLRKELSSIVIEVLNNSPTTGKVGLCHDYPDNIMMFTVIDILPTLVQCHEL